MSDTQNPPASPTFTQALKLWLKIGCISFGGPAGQIALMHKELVEDKRWISENRFLHALNYCMILPGPEAQQLATYIGWLLHGRWGGLIAGGLFVLPSLLLFWLLGWLYMSFGQLPSAQAILWGIKPVVVALVLAAAWRLASKTLKNNHLRAISLAALLAIVAGLGFVWIVLAAALLGIVLYRRQPSLFKAGGHGSSGKSYGASVIDDHTPIPAHAHYQPQTWRKALLVSLVLWVGSLSAVFFVFGQTHLYNHIAQFFSKAALLTFGGAYAVLPYVNHAMVVDYQWLSQAQMMDGLALGESTPGPLIMIVAFVGFVAGWQQHLGLDPMLNAMIASSLATFFTFLPSFIFIFLGAPVVEATRHLPKLHAPLTAISAAIVGVIVNLALFMAYHVFWPQGFGQTADYLALLLSVTAFVALVRFNIGVIPLLAVCASLGFVVKQWLY
ncbi:MAG: chromate efflux transporter [Moraxellaceae bacterium]|nr:chromate efflux transporter [Pseudomonadales bacterium]MCP5174591.1 chromate efflux transporter [Moraxellaceae bacterium]